ncbi:MAG: molybdenum cofactor biosynthesis protein MoaE, partial [Chloroflexota bacterium]
MQSSKFPTIYSITESEIDLNDLLAKITLTSTGAAAIFTGMVRGVTSRGDAHETEYLEYESYIPMAEAKMKQVADEIREKWFMKGISHSIIRSCSMVCKFHIKNASTGGANPKQHG